MRRDESALFFTGDENLVELAGVVEYRYQRGRLADAALRRGGRRATVVAAAEGVFREVVGRTPLEAILVGGRRGIRVGPGRVASSDGWTPSGLGVVVDRVRVVDAHPPREVVPAYRDVSAAVSDAERSLNQARADAAQRRLGALAEAEAIRDAARTRADRLVGPRRGREGGLPRQGRRPCDRTRP